MSERGHIIRTHDGKEYCAKCGRDAPIMFPCVDEVYVLIDAVLNLIQTDPHQWSTRPCSTCKTISTLVKKPFGCVLYAKQHNKI